MKRNKDLLIRGPSHLPQKKEGVIQQSGFGEFQPQKKVEISKKRDPVIVRKNSRKVITKQLENTAKNDYRIGSSSFVSLEVLEQMKCDDTEGVLKKKSRQGKLSSKSSTEPKKGSSENLPKTKSKKPVDCKINATGDTKHSRALAEGKKRNGLSERRKPSDSVSLAMPTEPKNHFSVRARGIPNLGSKTYKTKSFPSNADSSISMTVAAGEYFSPNTSNSYFSSESDVSKIDGKFMQIIESLTKSKIDFGDSKMLQVNDSQKSETVDNTSQSCKKKEDNEEDSTKSLHEKILKRINSLEKKLGYSKSKEENAKTEIREPCSSSLEDKALPVLEELWVTENSFRDDRSMTTNSRTKTETSCRENSSAPQIKAGGTGDIEKLEKRSGDAELSQDLKDLKVTLSESHIKLQEPANIQHNSSTGVSDNSIHSQSNRKPKAKVQLKQIAQKQAVNKTVPRFSELEKIEEDAEKTVETWTTLKRLKKALETLGMNMDDLSGKNLDEDVFSAKKKLQKKKCKSSGREIKNTIREETVKKNTGMDETVRKRARKVQVQKDPQYGIDSNGSGDKNTDNKIVKSTRKCEHLVKPRDNTDRAAYHAFVTHSLMQKKRALNQSTSGSLCNQKALTAPKRSSEEIMKSKKSLEPQEDGFDEYCYNPGWSRDNCRKGSAGSIRSYHDDTNLTRKKMRSSEHTLYMSCSFTSMTEDEEFKQKKRKKVSSSLKRNQWDNKVMEFSTCGKGDAAEQDLPPKTRKREKPEKQSCATLLNSCPYHEIMQLEKENDEIELKELRERHRQIISEIKTSLKEIRRQQSLYSRLQRKTKKIKKDYNSQKQMLISYLEDIETNFERGQGVDKYPRSASSDRCHRRIKKLQLRDKHYNYDDLRSRVRRKQRSYLGGLEGSPAETSSAETSVMIASYLELSTEESAKDDEKLYSLKLEKKTDREPRVSREIENYVPSSLTHFLNKLHHIILTEKKHLESLVMKASATSNSTMHSDKARASATTNSGHKQVKHQKKGTEDSGRAAKISNKNATSNSFEVGNCRHEKCREYSHVKSYKYHKFADIDGETRTMGKSIQCDPGGVSSADSIPSEREFFPSELYPNKPDSDTSLSHLEKEVEEWRYRKGDPSFRWKSHLLKWFGEQGKRPTTSQVEEEARRRKREVEQILLTNENNMKRNNIFRRESESHALDYDEHFGKSRQPMLLRHRQQSIIIDHNREEENEESQIVLGHASRHSGVTTGARRRKSPKEYYLKSEQTIGKSGNNSEIAEHQNDLISYDKSKILDINRFISP